MGRDEPARAPQGVKTAQARRRRKGDSGQVAVTQGWAKREAVKDPLIAGVQAHINHLINANNAERDTKHLHASEMCKGDWCPRASWYKVLGTPAKHEDSSWYRMNSILVEGNYIHEKWQTWLWDMGVLEGRWGCEDCGHKWWALAPVVCEACASVHIKYREVNVPQDDIMTWGHADGIYDMDGERAAIEIKSIGLGTLRYDAPTLHDALKEGTMTLDQVWNKIKTPFPVHIRQGMLYLRHLRAAHGIDKIRFIYEFKATQQFKSFLISYDERYLQKVIPAALAIKKAVDTGGTVKRPSWADDDHPVCKKCPYNKPCWGE